ncbi:MAG: DUF2007 domain-containing protein [Pirellulales bacterium]
MNEPHDLEVVYTHNDPTTAEIIKSALESEGIFCAIENEHQAGLAGVLLVRVMVPSEQADQARALIESHQGQALSDEDEDDSEEE